MKKVIAIVGARPQFIKHFPFELDAREVFNLKTIHTGQHYDTNMSQVFFTELGMNPPDFMLELGGGSHGSQTGKMLIEIEKILLSESPDLVVVYGDTNSTLAGALAASKLHIPIAHIEAGLRSFNKEMPEEINRVLTDHMSDLLFLPSSEATKNLNKEGIFDNVFVVGDIMKDLTYMAIASDWFSQLDIDQPFLYVTIHRPYNTDDKGRLLEILNWLEKSDKRIVFSIHPRTKNRLKEFNISEREFPNITFINPQSYFDNLGHLNASDGLITDSGGMQKEAYWLNKQCITVRSETEWTETLKDGANKLVFSNLISIDNCLLNKEIEFNSNLYGDGKAVKKIVDKITHFLAHK